MDATLLRLNDEGGCQRCGLIGCEWANGRGTQHRVADLESAAPNPSLTSAVTDALTTLDALHRVDPWANQCLTCGPEGGRWPCETHMVADDLRAALDGEGQS